MVGGGGLHRGPDVGGIMAVRKPGLLGAGGGKVQLPDRGVQAHDAAGEDLNLIGLLRGQDPEGGMGIQEFPGAELIEIPEHGAVTHVVAVDQDVLVLQAAAGVQEDAAAFIDGAIKQVAQVVVIVIKPLHNGVIDPGVRDVDPSYDIRIFLPQDLKIDGGIGMILWRSRL